MQLNYAVAMTMLKYKFMDDNMDHYYDAGVFMSTIQFSLICAFSDTSEIFDYKACLYAFIYLNQYYVAYYNKLDEYALKVHQFTEMG